MVNGSRGTVLVVEDDRAIRHVLRTALERNDYVVVETSDGTEALAVLTGDAHGVSAVVSDIGMPGLDGIALVETLDRRSTSVPVILTSGRHTWSALPVAVRERISGFITKPYTLDCVISEVAKAVHSDSRALDRVGERLSA